MSSSVIEQVIQLWAAINPVAGYTSGHSRQLSSLVFQTDTETRALIERIGELSARLDEIADPDLRATARAVLLSQATQLELARPSGAGPSGTGAGGVYAAADGVFYIVLKGDYGAPWVASYLSLVLKMVDFETVRWRDSAHTVEVKKECLATVSYMQGVLDALEQANPGLKPPLDMVRISLQEYQAIFFDPALVSADFDVMWAALQRGDEAQGATRAQGYPGTLQTYYTLGLTAEQVEQSAQDWLLLDLPVTVDLALRIGASLGLPARASLQTVWDAVSKRYAADFSVERMQQVLAACNDYGQDNIIGFTAKDIVKFSPTPSYLVNLVTGGEDFAVDYLTSQPFSQLYLTASKNTSLLTMINILVHEASHGFNFVMSARCAASPLLNVNTSLEVPMTEGQAFYREYQYYAAAAALLDKSNLTPHEQAYLGLYGTTKEEQRAAVLAAELETYIWRLIRYVRALCDVRVNGGKQTYTDFIAWAASETGLSPQTLHGECFTFLASPGYAPCYAVGGATYGSLSTKGYRHGVSELAFNTQASALGFRGWPQDVKQLEAIAVSGGGDHG
jgi:hypothetical protein